MTYAAFPAVAALAAALFLSACVSAPFSYAEDRCLGQQNQCRLECASIGQGPARASCEQRCLTLEDRCYTSGANPETSSLAEERLIGDLRNEAEKEAAFRRWKARRDAEEAAAAENAVEGLDAQEGGQEGGGE